jgi:lipopolysaccharide transport system ATP-binding protein
MRAGSIRAIGVTKRYRRRTGSASYASMRESLTQFLMRQGRARPALFAALSDVSFEAQAGEVLGLIGRNGAGKSTLLKILGRITPPTAGRVELMGRVGSLLEVGTGFHGELSGRDNIMLSGAILGMRRSEIRASFDEIVAFADIGHVLDTPVKYYSSGMYMRLAFAVAAHLNPEIMLVDEVLAVGDAEFQKKCLGKMEDVARTGRTVIFVSHNMNAIERLCNRVLWLDQGRLQEDSPDVRNVVRIYTGTVEGGHRRVEWVARDDRLANAWFTPTRFVLCDGSEAAITGPLANNQRAFVRIEGIVHTLDPALTIGYAAYAEDGTLLYWSLQKDGSPDQWPGIDKGPYAVESEFPRHLLNEGVYRLELIVSLHHRAWLSQPGVDAPSLVFEIRGGLSDSPTWMGARPGQLAPLIPWRRVVSLSSVPASRS